MQKYDPTDRLITEIHGDPDRGIYNTIQFAYDKAGNLTCITDNHGGNPWIEYDAMNREIRRTVKEGVANVRESAHTKPDEYSTNRCKGGEPIDMVTGSHLIEQCDFIINDINGIFAVDRTYESLLCTEDSLVGKGWTLNLFSRAIFFDDRIEVILPNNHTETFLKTADGYRNQRGGTKRLFLTEIKDGFAMQETRTGITRMTKIV